MELICKISQQYPLQQRDYTDRRSTSGRLKGKNGNPQTFHLAPIVLRRE